MSDARNPPIEALIQRLHNLEESIHVQEVIVGGIKREIREIIWDLHEATSGPVLAGGSDREDKKRPFLGQKRPASRERARIRTAINADTHAAGLAAGDRPREQGSHDPGRVKHSVGGASHGVGGDGHIEGSDGTRVSEVMFSGVRKSKFRLLLAQMPEYRTNDDVKWS
ncbi:hypothetical protein HK105_208445 [Polyrhizophydium stewartii]|uniref:Uncharacterized protein n=1 Tax=Polyrhizophydium stewartii TaxID=2732419 RepID=A0ABR4MXV1_9FUNG